MHLSIEKCRAGREDGLTRIKEKGQRIKAKGENKKRLGSQEAWRLMRRHAGFQAKFAALF